MSSLREFGSLGVAAALALGVTAGCSSHDGGEMPFGPGGMMGDVGSVDGPALMSVSPTGGAMGVATNGSMVLGFSHQMTPVGAPTVDLHEGDLNGPVVPITCGWSGDATTLTCHPDAPLHSGTSYTLHVGGGMTDAQGRAVDMEHYGPNWGGQWISGGMMGSGHGGSPWQMLPGGWQHSNGGYGMAVPFTTD